MNFDFEKLYAGDSDPWNFAASTYERGRYQSIIDALPRPAYDLAFEPGCSVGELTVQLAPLCGHLVACDIAPTAVARARARCADHGNVEIYCGDVAGNPGIDRFDLVVFSEIGDYFTRPRLREIALALTDRLAPAGDFVAAHWLGDSADHVLHGDDVHAELLRELPLRWLGGTRHAGFRIDAWRRS
jgi:hypothetical protein